MVAVTDVPQPLKWHGGKYYLASRIVALMPPHTHYVEGFAGGLSVLLAKPHDGVSEVANDTNGWLTNFWRVLADPDLFARMHRVLEATPFSEAVFLAAQDAVAAVPVPDGFDPATAAAWFFVCCRQSMAGRMANFAPLSRNRVRRGMNEQASAWLTAVEGLPQVHARLRRVVVLNRPAVEACRQQDGENTLFYLDPPYVPETRTSKDTYGPHEMTPDDHADLLDVASGLRGKVLISGYDCPLYRDKLAHWTRHTFDLPNNAAGGAEKRRMVEVVWCNF
jgi:DNA adenine methylase